MSDYFKEGKKKERDSTFGSINLSKKARVVQTMILKLRGPGSWGSCRKNLCCILVEKKWNDLSRFIGVTEIKRSKLSSKSHHQPRIPTKTHRMDQINQVSKR